MSSSFPILSLSVAPAHGLSNCAALRVVKVNTKTEEKLKKVCYVGSEERTRDKSEQLRMKTMTTSCFSDFVLCPIRYVFFYKIPANR